MVLIGNLYFLKLIILMMIKMKLTTFPHQVLNQFALKVVIICFGNLNLYKLTNRQF
jgi:hypothetical protein